MENSIISTNPIYELDRLEKRNKFTNELKLGISRFFFIQFVKNITPHYVPGTRLLRTPDTGTWQETTLPRGSPPALPLEIVERSHSEALKNLPLPVLGMVWTTRASPRGSGPARP